MDFVFLSKCINFVITSRKAMESAIIKIGNSKGLRLSKTILEKYNIKDKVELILEKGHIILKPIDSPRKDWEQEFKRMSEYGDDKLLMNDVFDDENLEEWN
jgi:antitoxin MazE